MNRHLLLTVGDDLNSLYGVRFAGSFFENKGEVKLTLLYIAPKFESMDVHEAAEQHKMDRRLAEFYREKGQAALDASQKHLTEKGFPENHITTKLMFKRYGTVKDIIHEARSGNYDAVILGRRGYSLFEKTFSNSVSREVMDSAIDFPIWVCRRPAAGRKNVLLCVDDTEPSMRIADHVGFILEREKDHMVTILHVDGGEGKDVEALLRRAREKLIQNYVSGERIRDLMIRSPKVVNSILEEAERGAYAAVAVGRGGSQPKNILRNWLIGSRSMQLLETLDKAALWVSK